MEKNIPLLEKWFSKGFFVLLFLLMVSLVGLAQGIVINTYSEPANPFVGHGLDNTIPILFTSHYVEGLTAYSKVALVISMQRTDSNDEIGRVSADLPTCLLPEQILNIRSISQMQMD